MAQEGVSGVLDLVALRRLRAENAMLRAAYARSLAREPRDALTGLWGWAHCERALAQELARSQRFWSPLGLLLLSLDDMRGVTDLAGPRVARRLVACTGRALGRLGREVDVCCSIGAGHFVVIMPQTNRTGVEVEQRRLVDLCELSLACELPRLPSRARPTLSSGAAVAPGDAQTASELLMLADEALLLDRRQRFGASMRTVPAPPFVAEA